jgi:hypothetical protein
MALLTAPGPLSYDQAFDLVLGRMDAPSFYCEAFMWQSWSTAGRGPLSSVDELQLKFYCRGCYNRRWKPQSFQPRKPFLTEEEIGPWVMLRNGSYHCERPLFRRDYRRIAVNAPEWHRDRKLKCGRKVKFHDDEVEEWVAVHAKFVGPVRPPASRTHWEYPYHCEFTMEPPGFNWDSHAADQVHRDYRQSLIDAAERAEREKTEEKARKKREEGEKRRKEKEAREQAGAPGRRKEKEDKRQAKRDEKKARKGGGAKK